MSTALYDLYSGGGYQYISVVPEEIHFKSVVFRHDLKVYYSRRTRIYEY